MTIQNRGAVTRFINFVSEVKSIDGSLRKLPEQLVNIAITLEAILENAPYDDMSVSPGQILKEAALLGFDTKGWKPHLLSLKKLKSAIETKGQGKEIRFKVDAKKISKLVEHMKLLFHVTNVTPKAKKKAS